MSSGNATQELAESRTPRRQRGRDRVAALTAAAAALFVEKGYDATTMTEIAVRAGASIGSLYLFFPNKAALARTIAMELADELSNRLDALQPLVAGVPAADIADGLFNVLWTFLSFQPAYGVLVELAGDDAWKHAVRARRRRQITALFGFATPKLPDGQPERLAMIVPELMRVIIVLRAQPGGPLAGSVVEELRAMLRHHLARPPTNHPDQAR